MRKILLIALLFITANTFAQINYEKGYFITKSNEKIECLIKNVGWKNNPENFEYKISEGAEIKIAHLDDIKYFEVENQFKYISATVNLDISTDNFSNLTKNKNPEYVVQKVFLKQLVNGKANLYEHVRQNVSKFFIQIDLGEIEPLVYKRYEIEENKIAYNFTYINQLRSMLICNDFQVDETKLLYKDKNLIKLINQYNQCSDPSYQVAEKSSGGFFNLNLRPRANFSSLNVINDYTKKTTDMGLKVGFGIGFEVEYVLAVNRNKWSLITEPTYMYYNSKVTEDVRDIVGGKRISEVVYKTMELPIGIRHYMFLNQKSKLFFNSQLVIAFPMKTKFDIRRIDGSLYQSFKIETKPNMAFGLGYIYRNKYGIEIKHYTSRNVTVDSFYFPSKFRNTSFSLSYNFL